MKTYIGTVIWLNRKRKFGRIDVVIEDKTVSFYVKELDGLPYNTTYVFCTVNSNREVIKVVPIST